MTEQESSDEKSNDPEKETNHTAIERVAKQITEESIPPEFNLKIGNFRVEPVEDGRFPRREEYELVSGLENKFKFVFINVGQNKFPGGKLTNLRMRSGQDVSSYGHEVELPEIDPNDSATVEFPLIITLDGNVVLGGDLEVPGEGSVKIDDSDENQFSHVFRSVPKEKYTIISTLVDIKQILEEN